MKDYKERLETKESIRESICRIFDELNPNLVDKDGKKEKTIDNKESS